MTDPDMKRIRRAYREATGKVGKRLTATDNKLIDLYIFSRQIALVFVIASDPDAAKAIRTLSKLFDKARREAEPWDVLESIELRLPDEQEISDYQRFLIERFGRGDA